MEHSDIRHKLSEYIDGSLSPGEKAEIKAHLETCATCSNAVRELQKTMEHIRSIEEVEPPAWMAQKIMAKIHSVEAKKKSLFQRLFMPFQIKIPLQAVVVLFLAIGAFYIYRSIEPASRIDELPSGRLSSKQRDSVPPAGSSQSSPSDRAQDDLKKRESSSIPEQQIPQTPAYRSLDMKPEYAMPVPPNRKDGGTAPASDLTNQVEQPSSAGGNMLMEKSAAAPHTRALSRGSTHQGRVNEQSLALAGKAKAAVKESVISESTASRVETEAVALKKLDDYFINHDLPRTMKDRKYIVRKIRQIPADIQWMDPNMREKLASCKNSYLIDVEPLEKTLRCVYCTDNDSVDLLGKYTYRNDRWIHLE